MTHYETLDVAQDASAAEIKAAWRRAAREHHPDREGGSDERMRAINAAYDVLNDPAKRKRYDAAGCKEGPTIEDLAAQLLAQLIDRAIDAGGDVLDVCRRTVNDSGEDLAEKMRNNRARHARYTPQLGKIERKSAGPNLVEQTLQRKLAGLEAEHAQMLEAQAVQRAVLALLADYEGPPPAPAPGSAQGLRMQMLAAMQNVNSANPFSNNPFQRG